MFHRSRPQPDSRVDGVIVSAGCTFAKSNDEVEPLLETALRVRRSEGNGVVAVLTRNLIVRAADAADRQLQFAKAFAEIIARADACGVTADFLRRNEGDFWLSLSLSPATGQAGVVLTPEMISEIAARGGYVDVDALA